MPSQTEFALQIIIIRHFDRLGCKFSFMLYFYLSVKYGNACYLVSSSKELLWQELFQS